MTSTGKYVSEEELNARAVAPRVTLESLEANIMSEHYFTAHQGARASLLDQMVQQGEGTVSGQAALDAMAGLPTPLRLLTMCVLVLKNGFTITGTSSCASPENYNEDIGRRVARGDAIRQVWGFMGYHLRSQLHELAELRGVDDRLGEALTRLTAFGMGNKEVLRSGDADIVLTHFLHHNDDRADIARAAVKTGVDLIEVPIAEPLSPVEEPDEQDELGARHTEFDEDDGA